MTKYSFKRKLRVLNKIVQEEKKYKPYCRKIECYVDKKFIIIKEIYDKYDKRNAVIKIPTSELDITIIRFRAKLHQVKELSKDIEFKG